VALPATPRSWWRSTAKLSRQLSKEPAEVVVAVRAKLEDFQVRPSRAVHTRGLGGSAPLASGT
jgi:hypothetical protein